METSPAHPRYLSATPLATLRWLIRLRWGTAFLTRVFAERFGGSLTVQSDRGTTAIQELPRETGEAKAT